MRATKKVVAVAQLQGLNLAGPCLEVGHCMEWNIDGGGLVPRGERCGEHEGWGFVGDGKSTCQNLHGSCKLALWLLVRALSMTFLVSGAFCSCTWFFRECDGVWMFPSTIPCWCGNLGTEQATSLQTLSRRSFTPLQLGSASFCFCKHGNEQSLFL